MTPWGKKQEKTNAKGRLRRKNSAGGIINNLDWILGFLVFTMVSVYMLVHPRPTNGSDYCTPMYTPRQVLESCSSTV
jgi:hypothetical protein